VDRSTVYRTIQRQRQRIAAKADLAETDLKR
jgi:hypothetical protein